MRTVKIVTDSTSDLPYSLLKEHDIDIVPLYIILGERSFLDDNSFKAKDLFLYADKYNVLPKTSAAKESQFTKTFKKWLDEDYDIFFVGISSKLSATVPNAMSAASQLDRERIAVFDSLSLSTGVGLQALEASDLARSGGSLKEIMDKAQSVRARIQASFVVDTLKYLYTGGRCSRLSSVAGGIKPKLELSAGEIIPTDKLRGGGFVKKYYSHLMEEADKIDPKRVFVTHCLSDKADEIKGLLETEHDFKNVYLTDASSVISVHCGPKALGIMYLYK
jgi:DegV family protein with EDD domain